MRLSFSVLAFFFLLAACSSDRQDGTFSSPQPGLAAPVLELNPPEATRETMFYIKSDNLDLSKAEVKWLINGGIVEGATSIQFGSPIIRKNDKIQSIVTVAGHEIVSNQVTVKNIPPVISGARIIPPNPKANDILKASITSADRDGDKMTFLYEWSKNGENAGNRETLEGPFKRSDKISVKITPYDGEDYGPPLILNTNICNSPPKVVADGSSGIEKNAYSYQIKAVDPDGDQLAYSLKAAPPGMTVDPVTGLIRWSVPSDFRGSAFFTISVTDGHGGETLQSLYVDVSVR